MSKKTKVFTPENMKIIAELRTRKVPNTQIAKIFGVSPSALARNVRKNDLPRQEKSNRTGTSISLEEMAARPKAQTITERRAVAYAPEVAALPSDMVMAADARTFRTDPVTGKRGVSFVPTPRHVVEEAKSGREEEQRWKHPRLRDRADNPFLLKARVCEFNRDRRALIEAIDAEIDKAFRKFITIAGPNVRIQDVDFGGLSPEPRTALDHLQALIDASRNLHGIDTAIGEATFALHKAGAVASSSRRANAPAL
ncbi:hypothetical protein GUK30_32655 [Rhizobium leguminosarum]|uniref:hypothetical protein n=1 Tax=Rhizobium ruizarguesonis TaxID=2081791 RepID=UPI0013BFA588|nr:hypothetical protein [Rhizobium ruizarguesonis]NEI24099.1 hypothetical protein [Rhizobium ruizarguesonis]